ncbi:16S rRNA (cytosine(1402)-N(4))-methyltransferase RsmH [Leucothrix arctica]|uniref:Ribosomal RNA small subunit methyltransferase H n=1 Tax=Leucothrix arctica TaxID=1481894 RepID=A0A317CK71_9GAMM|nr:16S rRNA (cytosine(1402)-N(4))-methyltransferase RsmH [Leucothrix arctica]PWQ98729.1 16S rRNA (cytosine(1402)-N(4))-methyltransferase [Leucothrix arctica]
MADDFQHVTVLLDAAVDALSVKPDGIYIDGTFGRGGHTRKIIEQLGAEGRLLVVDKDPQAIAVAKELYGDDPRVSIYHGSFAEFDQALADAGWPQEVDGVLLDLGVSSPQIDDGTRGFSFQRDGALDMRMNPEQGMSAAEWLATAKDTEIMDVLWKYGDERFARRIVRQIIETRETEPLVTTMQLAKLIAGAVPRKFHGKKNPATKSFQAIRIFINQELADLEKCLEDGAKALVMNGRMVVISFHSLEDRMVKRYFKAQSTPKPVPRGLPILESDIELPFRTIGKAIKPSTDEVSENIRSRSSVMRILERKA